MNSNIIPLVGFDKVKFGQTRDEVIKLLGSPDEIEEDLMLGTTPDEATTVFYYDDLVLSLSFEKEEGYRLTEISFDRDYFSIEDKIKTGMTMDDVLAAATELGLGYGYEEDVADLVDSDNVSIWVYEEKNVDFYFEDKILTTIQIGPEFSEDGDSIIWPK